MAPNLWFKTPINAIQGLTTHPVNALHIVREDIQILGKGFGFCIGVPILSLEYIWILSKKYFMDHKKSTWDQGEKNGFYLEIIWDDL